MTNFGTAVRDTRLQLGLTQIAVAERVGIDQTHLSKIETGARTASRTTSILLCQTLGLNIAHWVVAFVEDFAFKQERDHGTPREETMAAVRQALAVA